MENPLLLDEVGYSYPAAGNATSPPLAEQPFSAVERLPNAEAPPQSDNRRVILFDEFDTKTGGRLDALDITPEVEEMVRASGVTRGSVLVFSPHTTCCILIARANNGTVEALARAMESIAPADAYYAHDDLAIRTENLTEDEPPNAPAHLVHAFAGRPSECIPIVEGRAALGAGQRVLFVELDASRERRYAIQVVGE